MKIVLASQSPTPCNESNTQLDSEQPQSFVDLKTVTIESPFRNAQSFASIIHYSSGL